MALLKSLGKNLLYATILFTIIFLLLAIIIILWTNEFNYTNSQKPIATIVTSNYVNNIDGSSSFKISLTKPDEISNLDHILNPDSKGKSTTEEYIVNGRNYTLEIVRIDWSDLFKSFGLDHSYKIILLSSNYADSLQATKYGTDSFIINGGNDELLKSISQNPDLAHFFANSITFEKNKYDYLEAPLVRTIK